jgi:hypothetical protein
MEYACIFRDINNLVGKVVWCYLKFKLTEPNQCVSGFGAGLRERIRWFKRQKCTHLYNFKPDSNSLMWCPKVTPASHLFDSSSECSECFEWTVYSFHIEWTVYSFHVEAQEWHSLYPTCWKWNAAMLTGDKAWGSIHAICSATTPVTSLLTSRASCCCIEE